MAGMLGVRDDGFMGGIMVLVGWLGMKDSGCRD